MENIAKSLYNIRTLEEWADKKTLIHDINPLVKLIITIVFLVITISFDKYEISRLIPLILYPIIMMTLSELPFIDTFKRLVIAAPLVIGLGIFNPIFDTKPLIVLPFMQISGGWISFLSVVIKCILTVSAAFILIGTTGIMGIASALRSIKVPKIFVMQILLTYRYIHLLIEEVASLVRAYSLRSPREKGINLKVCGSLTGQLLIRTIDRAQSIYVSMRCRGFNGDFNIGKENSIQFKDIIFLLFWILYFMFLRYVNISNLVGNLITGGIR